MPENKPEISMHLDAGKEQFKFARFLRENMTKSEKILWEHLRKNQLGVKIRRQHPIGNFVADFYCHQAKLIIELDGKYHKYYGQKKNDNLRDDFFKDQGIKVLRITDDEVFTNIKSVVKKIKNKIDSFLTEN